MLLTKFVGPFDMIETSNRQITKTRIPNVFGSKDQTPSTYICLSESRMSAGTSLDPTTGSGCRQVIDLTTGGLSVWLWHTTSRDHQLLQHVGTSVDASSPWTRTKKLNVHRLVLWQGFENWKWLMGTSRKSSKTVLDEYYDLKSEQSTVSVFEDLNDTGMEIS